MATRNRNYSLDVDVIESVDRIARHQHLSSSAWANRVLRRASMAEEMRIWMDEQQQRGRALYDDTDDALMHDAIENMP